LIADATAVGAINTVPSFILPNGVIKEARFVYFTDASGNPLTSQQRRPGAALYDRQTARRRRLHLGAHPAAEFRLCDFAEQHRLPRPHASLRLGVVGTGARMFSDFELHHMGTVLADNIKQGNAGGDQFRTAPLWGLFLHDGRTSNLIQARALHQSTGSDANPVILNCSALSVNDKQDVLYFLRSLDPGPFRDIHTAANQRDEGVTHWPVRSSSTSKSIT
jgi:hypothetical protein